MNMSLEETVENIDRNVEEVNRKLSKLKDIFQLFEHHVKNSRYALSPAGYQKILEGYQNQDDSET